MKLTPQITDISRLDCDMCVPESIQYILQICPADSPMRAKFLFALLPDFTSINFLTSLASPRRSDTKAPFFFVSSIFKVINAISTGASTNYAKPDQLKFWFFANAGKNLGRSQQK